MPELALGAVDTITSSSSPDSSSPRAIYTNKIKVNACLCLAAPKGKSNICCMIDDKNLLI